MRDHTVLAWSLALGLTGAALTIATGIDPFDAVVHFFARHGTIGALSRLGLIF